MIELHSISKSFGEQEILRDISLKVVEGDKLAVIGQSGIGKSVMMKLMTGLLKPSNGKVLIDEVDVTAFTPRQWNPLLRDFGVVFQGAALFDSLTILENVGIRLYEERNLQKEVILQQVSDALRSVGLKPEEVLSKYPSEISGGMQKRAGIARAIVHRPKYVFYDEPTTGLDPINSERIDALMQELSSEKGRTSIIITHDMHTVKEIASKVAMIHDKHLHFFGTPKELYASNDPVVRAFLQRTR